jgi:rhomboid protease GluP
VKQPADDDWADPPDWGDDPGEWEEWEDFDDWDEPEDAAAAPGFADDDDGEDLVDIGAFDDEEVLHEYGLVVLSQGEPYWVEEDDDGIFYLLVEPRYAEFLSNQLDLYERESRYWPPLAPLMAEVHAGGYAAMIWLATLVFGYLCQLRWPAFEEWGMASSEAIRDGEVYRCLSALFLHADVGHLAGNMVFGAVFLHLVARHIGSLFAWLAVLAAGSCGNFLNAVLHFETSHYSIGASTAVFGAVGILVTLPVGFGIRHARFKMVRFWVLPVLVGMVFLAWFGTGGERTDTAAHLTGFVCGLPIGLLAGIGVGKADPAVPGED